jgi:hypothetical protein
MLKTFALALALTAAASTARAATCNASQTNSIRNAKMSAVARIQTAKFTLDAIGPSGPRGQANQAVANRQRAAMDSSRAIFGSEAGELDFSRILLQMTSRLNSPQTRYSCERAGAQGCRSNAGFVVTNDRNTIHLCPRFFTGSAEQRIRTLVHESAHQAGIYVAGSEGYCPIYDCRTACGAGQSESYQADNWSQLVHCASGQRPDAAPAITGRKH